MRETKIAQWDSLKDREPEYAIVGEVDLVVVRFGDQYKQWNAAFDAGYAAALGKSLIIMHGADHQHALKEIDGAALAVVETADQVAAILHYVHDGVL